MAFYVYSMANYYSTNLSKLVKCELSFGIANLSLPPPPPAPGPLRGQGIRSISLCPSWHVKCLRCRCNGLIS